MLRVTVEMVPFGIESEKYTIGKMEIANVKTYKNDKANYTIIVDSKQAGKIKGFERKRGAWELVFESIMDAFNIDPHSDCDCY